MIFWVDFCFLCTRRRVWGVGVGVVEIIDMRCAVAGLGGMPVV